MTPVRRRLRSLPVQLIGLLSLALLPLGLISLYQTQIVLEEARSLNRASLKGRTIEAAMAERELIQEALGAARGLGAVVAIADEAECRAVTRNFIETHPQFVHAAFVQADGTMTCSSEGRSMNLAGADSFETALNSMGPSIEMTRRGVVTGQSVVLARQTVVADGEVLGYISISIPHRIANALMSRDDVEEGLRLATVNAEGDVVSATGGVDAATGFLPRDIPRQELLKRSGDTFDAYSGDGEERVFSVGWLIPDRVAIVGSWPQKHPAGTAGFLAWMSMLFPVLMWATGILVAFFGIQRLVIRHITDLRSAMRRFALGDLKGGRLELDNPPEELLDAERAFNRMVVFLAQAEAQKEQDLRDKEVLLREVHHRVKNNLQLIASIMNMQARNARTPEARRMLAGLQRRVRGLAMLHRTLYTTPEYATVDAAELVEAVVQDLTSAAGLPGIDIDMSLLPVRLYPDQAVPLSMLLAEALTNAIKHLGAPSDGTSPRLSITMTEDTEGRRACLTIRNTKGRLLRPEEAADGGSEGLGSRLMAAFVSQLEGVAEVEETDDFYRYEVSFLQRDFDPAGPSAER